MQVCSDCREELTEDNPVLYLCWIKSRTALPAILTMCSKCGHNERWAKKDKSYMILYPEEV